MLDSPFQSHWFWYLWSCAFSRVVDLTQRERDQVECQLLRYRQTKPAFELPDAAQPGLKIPISAKGTQFNSLGCLKTHSTALKPRRTENRRTHLWLLTQKTSLSSLSLIYKQPPHRGLSHILAVGWFVNHFGYDV